MFAKRLSEPTNSTQAPFAHTKKKEDQPSILALVHTHLFQVDQALTTIYAHLCTSLNQGSTLLGPSPKKGKSFSRHFCVFQLDFRIQASTNQKTPFWSTQTKAAQPNTAVSVWESRSHDLYGTRAQVDPTHCTQAAQPLVYVPRDRHLGSTSSL